MDVHVSVGAHGGRGCELHTVGAGNTTQQVSELLIQLSSPLNRSLLC